MEKLEIKKHNTISTETQKQYQRYNQAKLIYENILQAKKYYPLAKAKL